MKRLALAIAVLASCVASAGEDGVTYEKLTGLAPIRDREIRVWVSNYLGDRGYVVSGNVITRFLIHSPPDRERITRTKTRISSDIGSGIVAAMEGLTDLDNKTLSCKGMLDGDTVQIDARLHGRDVYISVDDPFDCDTAEGRRIVSLLNLIGATPGIPVYVKKKQPARSIGK